MTAPSRAAVLDTPRHLAVVERATPEPRPGEALVRITATAVCHTDLEIYTGRHPGVRYPVVMGHEASGVVEALGAGVSRVHVGQRVLINPIIACGACDLCRRGYGNLCRNAGLLGREMDGSLADHVTLPDKYLYALPDHIAPDVATLIETLATVYHGQQRVGIATGDIVVVLGQGASGLLHTQLARIAGAGMVIGISRSRWKLDLALALKADHAISAGPAAMASEVSRLTDGRGADVVIDTTGSPDLVAPALDLARPGGRILMYGIGHRPIERLNPFPVYFKELTIYGSRALLADDFEPSIELVASGAIDVDRFVTGTYPLRRVADAFADYERDPDRVLRMVIVPGEVAA